MNNPDDLPIDVEAEREWANAYRLKHELSWSRFALLADVPMGTLQPFCKGNYQGNNERVARAIYRLRQMEETQSDLAYLAEDVPYFETPTSRRIEGLLKIAHMGRVTAVGTAPGTGKTITAWNYALGVPLVFVVTMRQSTRTLNGMILQVLRVLEGTEPKGNNTQALSRRVTDNLRGKRKLLIIDEAQHLTWEALEEIRSWHDETGTGICLLGNEELIMRIEGGPRRDAFARMNSRIAVRHVQNLPEQADAEAFCDAWKISDAGMRRLLIQIALTPAAGGLRECRQIVEAASMFAIEDQRPISLADLRDAQATRATRNIRA